MRVVFQLRIDESIRLLVAIVEMRKREDRRYRDRE